MIIWKSFSGTRLIAFLCAIIILSLAPSRSWSQATAKPITPAELKRQFKSPPAAASPWVFWYWMYGAVREQAITADLEAMKEAGIGGAYLMPIKDTASPSLMNPPVRQLSPEWWKMINHTMKESKRLGLKIGMHVSDGFALAGGPWITPELSMQKVVWTKTQVEGTTGYNAILKQPETIEWYYKDIAVFAYPSPEGAGVSTQTIKPKITGSKGETGLDYLVEEGNTKSYSCDDQCWIQYEFPQPFTTRAIIIKARNNYQSNRLVVEISDDGKSFRSLGRLDPPRHGWQDVDADYTHAIPPVTARFFRFKYDKSGSEPGSEDLDAAKWKPSFKIIGIALSGDPVIDEYEGKNGEVWRVSKRTTTEQLPDNRCIKLNTIIDLSGKMDKSGRLTWDMPAGNWTILRMGHTSTGHKNDTGGAGKGLECDKFNPEAIKLQFNKWYGEIYRQVPADLTSSVLKIFHVDSWECGSQNWSPVFMAEFKRRRGYNLYPYLPAIAGVPLESADVSERFLYDVRETIAELVAETFYVTLAKLAHEKGLIFSAESVAPTMLSDGMLHYQYADIPMGEYWLRSPTHDKPNDMLDAISGGHIYGKPIIQAEAFTELRMSWDEHPGVLKTLADRNFALGFNRLVYHVFTHNPWLERKPGMTLDAIGLFFQRDQTWWKQSRAWVDYTKRCQALLQIGRPVSDIAVFTGEELPRRAVLPDRLVPVFPGIFGKERVEQEANRLANKGEPLRTLPAGVTHSANMADPEKWIDPLEGYAYDSYNVDALLRLSKVRSGRIELPGGASYGLLVLPGSTKMSPNGNLMSSRVAARIKQLVSEGANVLMIEQPTRATGQANDPDADKSIRQGLEGLSKMSPIHKEGINRQGNFKAGVFSGNSFEAFGITKDFIAIDEKGKVAEGIAWTHRAAPGLDIYFISNQDSIQKLVDLSLRVNGRVPEIFDPLTGDIYYAGKWRIDKGRTLLPVKLELNGSLFVILQQPAKGLSADGSSNWIETKAVNAIKCEWRVSFNPEFGGPGTPVVFKELNDWSKSSDSAVRYYSGTAVYSNKFDWAPGKGTGRVWLNLGHVANIAEVYVNDVSCGIAWTFPYRVDITHAVNQGNNSLKVEVSNTWANRLIGDHNLPEAKRITNTISPYRLEGRPLLEAGLLGPVVIELAN